MTKYNKNNFHYKQMCERVGKDFEEWLIENYWDKELDSRKLAVMAYDNIKNGPNITVWMEKLGIPRRSRSDAIALQWKGNDERREVQAELAVKHMGAGTPSREKLIKKMQTKEYRLKASLAKRGEKNGMYGVVGENNPRWNPDLTDRERLKSRKYAEYEQFRKSVFERDDYTCMKCSKRGGDLVVHHINGYHWDKYSRTEIDNGATLCEYCHDRFHATYGYQESNLFQFAQFMDLTLTN